MIETWILGVLCVGAALIGYFVGKTKAEELYLKKYGWIINTWQGKSVDRYFVAAQKGNRQVVLAFGPNGTVDFDYNIKKDGEQR